MRSPSIRCVVVEMPDPSPEAGGNRLANRPRDLLPWADPYIAQLIAQHERQLRERESRETSTSPRPSAQLHNRLRHAFRGEAPPPFDEGLHPQDEPLRHDESPFENGDF